MKILIISMARCYTKNFQNLLADYLGPDQVTAGYRRHLGELLHFTEATQFAIDTGTGTIVDMDARSTPLDTAMYQHPILKDGRFVYEDCPRKEVITYDYVNTVVDELEKVNPHWVLKVFLTTS